MSPDFGIVCGKCDWLNAPGEAACVDCGNELVLFPIKAAAAGKTATAEQHTTTADDAPGEGTPSPTPEKSLPPTLEEAGPGPASEAEPSDEEPVSAPPSDEQPAVFENEGVTVVRPQIVGQAVGPQPGSEELQMEQARHYVCTSCYSPIPGGHKFCGKCGASTNFAEEATSTQFFGAMQVPNKAKLILIKGEGLDGISYHLNSTEHVAGRQQGAILFPDDTWLSPRHANFFYRNDKLFVRDEDSVNGVFCRIGKPVTLESGRMFMCGEQLFRFETSQPPPDGPQADGTYFYASPCKNWSYRVVQILRGGIEGMVVHDEEGKVVIGREGCDVNFVRDVYLSPRHAQLERSGSQVILTDLESQNGTFVRIQDEQELLHGDYVFLGKQLLRVEVTN